MTSPSRVCVAVDPAALRPASRRRLGQSGADRQGRVDRPAVGLMAAGRPEPAEELPVRRRALQQGQPGRRQVRDGALRQQGGARRRAQRLKSAIDQGIRYVVQGNGSGAATAISTPSTKHNERNPGKEVLYFNYAAVDPELTNSKCSYWHFRIDANSDHEDGGADHVHEGPADVKKVYLINQNYSFGHQVAQVRQGDTGAQAPRRADRRRGPAPAGPGRGLRALHRQDQGLGRRHGDHRQLGSAT